MLDSSIECSSRFNEPGIPKYAILSHTWEKDEISYAEASVLFSFSIFSAPPKAGFEKIKQFAAKARTLGLDHTSYPG
jgi:hypothetical protein